MFVDWSALKTLRILYSGDMKRAFLILVICGFSLPVLAQDNVITIIRDDGSKEVIDLGGSAPKPEVVKTPPKVVVETPVQNPARDVEAQAPVPVPVEQKEAKPSKPKPVAALAKTKTLKPKTVKREAVQKPLKKPHRQILPAGEPITKEKALYIALAEAPPSKDVRVYSTKTDEWYDYSVMFKVEEGDYEVVVDGLTGVIKDSGYVDADQTLVKPGHLPVR